MPFKDIATFIPDIMIMPINGVRITDIKTGTFEEAYAYFGLAVILSSILSIVIATILGGPAVFISLGGLVMFICIPIFGFDWYLLIENFVNSIFIDTMMASVTYVIRLVRYYWLGFA